jgi:hemerythrin-like metal-binding protein
MQNAKSFTAVIILAMARDILPPINCASSHRLRLAWRTQDRAIKISINQDAYVAREKGTIVSKIAQWSDQLSLGIPEIDGQHRGLLEIINELWDAIVAKADMQRVTHILNELELYTHAHFTAEEALMRVEDYPSFRAHREEHKRFINQVASAKTKLAGGEFLGLDLLRYLTDWLVKHIQGGDKDYAKFIAEQHHPKSFFARLFGVLRPRQA